MLVDCENAGTVLPIDHNSKMNFTAGNQECEPLLRGSDNGGMMPTGATRKNCFDTEDLVAYKENEEVTGYGFESDSEDSIHDNPQLQVKGRLRERLQFWKECLQAPTFILDTIKTGCHSNLSLPPISDPTGHQQ